MSGWAQRDAERKEEEARSGWSNDMYDGRDIDNMVASLDAIDDMLICDWIAPPFTWSPEEYRNAINKLVCSHADRAIYFEHQRLIKLNEDFYGPAFKENDVPFT